LQGKNVKAAGSDTRIGRLQERRNRLCRLTPDLALETLDEAHVFLRDRGLLTRTTDCSLPSLFEACHEEPYAPDKPGFGQWPRTKWGWSFALAQRPGVYALKIHHRRKTLYVSEEVARLLDPILRAEIERMRENDEWAVVLDHLADAGPSTSEDLRTELGLKPPELKKLLYPLELCGTVLVRALEPDENGMVEGFEYVRWDQVYPEPAPGGASLDELVVAGVRAAVVASEREIPRWFAWRWRFEPDLVERLVSEGRLERPERGWIAAPASE
jgi:transcription initiation factor TFIIE alpha subunit-like protein